MLIPAMIHAETLRRQFPIFSQEEPLIYLDSAATAQKPVAVLDAVRTFYETSNANVHRGMHALTERATDAYESARCTVQQFINASAPHEILFTKNCTESVNIIAHSWGQSHLKEGDTVLLSILEHHSVIVPWMQLQQERGICIKWIEINEEGELDREQYQKALERGTVKLVCMTGLSNVIGVKPPLRQMIGEAHAAGARVLVDAAQLSVHHPSDVQRLDCDFLAFSGHKLYGPTGIGVLYGKEELLRDMPPAFGGGGMIEEVTRDHFICADLPIKFEAGTPPIAQAVGLAAAIDWLREFAWEDIEAHEHALIDQIFTQLQDMDGVHILGPKNPRAASGCVSCTVDGIHPHDVAEFLGEKHICLRAGHHCAQPLHAALGTPVSTRISVALYNTSEDIDALVPAIREAQSLFSHS